MKKNSGSGSSLRPLIAISAYYAIVTATYGLSKPGTPLYLALKGLDGNLINAILSLAAIIGLSGGILLGFLSDRMLSRLVFVEIGTAAWVVGYFTLAIISDRSIDLLTFGLVYIAATFVGSAAAPVNQRPWYSGSKGQKLI